MRALKVYLAAPYVCKNEIKAYADELIACGVEITASWINEPHAPTTPVEALTHEENQGYAIQDLRDVAAADVLVFFTDPTKSIIRAGRHVEFGFAAAIGIFLRPMPILVVGMEQENIFHHLPQVRHYGSWDHVKEILMDLAKVAAHA